MSDWGWEGFTLPPRPMVEEIQCPKCGRKGAVRKQEFRRIVAEHTCPGPWTLQKVVQDKWTGYSLIFWSLTHEDILKAGWRVPEEAAQ